MIGVWFVLITVLTSFCAAMARPVVLGPANPGAEYGMTDWFSGTLGGGSVTIDSDPASGVRDFKIGITNASAYQVNHADFRSLPFPLHQGRRVRGPVTFSLDYKLPDEVKQGDNIEVNLRFFDRNDFLRQKTVLVGSKSGDSQMTEYRTMTLTNIAIPEGATRADVWVVANIGSPWTSGYAQFDNFVVAAIPEFPWMKVSMVGCVIVLASGLLYHWLYVRPRRYRQI
jgi:hypothetical protein